MKKLQQKSNLHIIILLSILLVLSMFFFYQFLTLYILDEMEEQIYLTNSQVIESIISEEKVPDFKPLIEIRKINKMPERSILSDTTIYNKYHAEEVTYRQLNTIVNINDIYYEITIRNSYIETEEMVIAVSWALFLMLIIVFLGIFFIQKTLQQSLWNPFYQTLKIIQEFQIRTDITPEFNETDTEEFETLNNVLNEFINRIQNDFAILKAFTENASHEMQTPVTIIQNKLELLIQDQNLKDDQAILLHSIYNSTHRISNIIQGLLLLAKIENQQFNITEEVQLDLRLNSILAMYQEIFISKEIKVTHIISTPVYIKGNADLIDILLTNLLKNAYQHNIEKGWIEIELTKRYLTISNTSNYTDVSPELLFNRFVKFSDKSDSVGLGLSIVKTIIDLLKLKIDYQIVDKTHTVTITF